MKKLFSILSSGMMLGVFSNVKAPMAKESPIDPATPEKILPKGVDFSQSINPFTGEAAEVRKGTVAATINNVAALNKLLQENPTPETRTNIEQISKEVCSLLISLRVVGLFDIFSPLEWMSTSSQPGRILIAVLYIEKFPENLTPQIIQQLERIKASFLNGYLLEKIDRFLKKPWMSKQSAKAQS